MFATTAAFSFFSLVLARGAAAASVLPATRDTPSTCNGQASFCDRSYGNITFWGAHDSYAWSTDPLALARDQKVNITAQLNLGVRLLQAQAHLSDSALHFCHTSCLLFDGGLVSDYLAEVKSWLDANPDEFLTFVFTNPDALDVAQYWAPAFQSAGMDTLAYTPPNDTMPQSAWPTLGELLGGGARYVAFMDYNSNQAEVPYILSEFPNVWETPYDVTDSSFPCSVNRTAGPLADDEHMYMINHFLDVDIAGVLLPDEDSAGTTNGVDSILAESYDCTQFAAGRAPNFILLDWVDVGQGQAAADALNGV